MDTLYNTVLAERVAYFVLLICSIISTNLSQNFLNLLVLTFSKHPLHVQFDQVLAEIFKVKDSLTFIFMIIDLTERKTIEIWTFCVKSN